MTVHYGRSRREKSRKLAFFLSFLNRKNDSFLRKRSIGLVSISTSSNSFSEIWLLFITWKIIKFNNQKAKKFLNFFLWSSQTEEMTRSLPMYSWSTLEYGGRTFPSGENGYHRCEPFSGPVRYVRVALFRGVTPLGNIERCMSI